MSSFKKVKTEDSLPTSPDKDQPMTNGNSSNGHVSPAVFGAKEFSAEEGKELQDLLEQKLGKEELATRRGPGNCRL
jgi:hypothetical protein